jgi:hypothetical protein
MSVIVEEARKVAENAVLVVQTTKFGSHPRNRLYVRDPRIDRDDRIGFSRVQLEKSYPVASNFKLPIPWETVLEGTPYSRDDAHDSSLPVEEKAEIWLASAEYDGFGKEWVRSTFKPPHTLTQAIQDELE